MRPRPSGSPSYAFGDSDRAVRRLALLADVLAPPSRALVRDAQHGRPPPHLAIDLGSGPGFTTALLAAAGGPVRTVGLDRSPAFVATARRIYPHLAFAVHDVTVTPFPERPADLAYARLVLAHLPDPDRRARAWTGELAPGGRLVLEETEWMDNSHPVLAGHEELVLAVVGERRASLYAGAVIAALDLPSVTVQASGVRDVTVPRAAAARIYALNLQEWRHDAYAREHFEPAALDELAARLGGLAATGGPAPTWGMRQVVLERG